MLFPISRQTRLVFSKFNTKSKYLYILYWQWLDKRDSPRLFLGIRARWCACKIDIIERRCYAPSSVNNNYNNLRLLKSKLLILLSFFLFFTDTYFYKSKILN